MNPKKKKEKDRRRARKLSDEAWEAANAGNLDLAEKIIRRAVAAQKDNPAVWTDQGVLLAMRDKAAEAERSFRAAIRLSPTFVDAYAQLAALRAREGYLDDAIAWQTQAVQQAPQDAALAERLETYRALARQQPHRSVVEPPAEEAGSVVAQPAADSDGTGPLARAWRDRVAALDWESLGDRLTREGVVLLPGLFDPATCAGLRDLFDREELFARTVVMDQPHFGKGVYRYFKSPVPEVVTALRCAVHPHAARIVNHWQGLLAEAARFPEEWTEFRELCRQAGQTVPTPILLKYGPGGFNALHRDLRGEVYFPLQLAVVLSPRAAQGTPQSEGFVGGDFLLCDVPERPKSRRREIAAGLGDGLLFCTRDRLERVGSSFGLQPVKHGVAEITSGTRLVLGVPFHEYR
jgi:hypothetical protein